MKTNSLHRQSGLNLIEILVAALILSVGLLSMAGLQVASLKSAQNATQKQQASSMVHELLERMRSNRGAALAGAYNATVSCASATPPLDCTGSTTCTPTQLASYDVYNIQCGSNSATATRSGMVDRLLNGALAVSCPSGDCTGGIAVTMNWSELLASDDLQEDVDGTPTSIEMQTFTLTVNAVI